MARVNGPFSHKKNLSMRNLFSKTVLAAVLAVGCSASVLAASNNTVATVNGMAIPQARAEAMMRQLTSQGQPDTAEVRAMVRDELIMTELLRQQATKKGLDKTAEYKAELEGLSARLLANMYVRNWVRTNPIGEAELRTRYERLKAQMAQKEYHPRHILVATEAEAVALLEDLKKGKRFDELAKAKSLDAGSKEKGGDLGWMMPNVLDQAFAAAMMKLERGQITATPVKSQFGWHIIQLGDVRDSEFPPLEGIRAQLTQQIQNERLQGHLNQLKQTAKVN